MACLMLSGSTWLRVARGLLLGMALLVALAPTAARAAGDAPQVAALDVEYQAAVKNSDSATMARLLADDFVLVTGTGKRFPRATC